jgi:hypothetical protein
MKFNIGIVFILLLFDILAAGNDKMIIKDTLEFISADLCCCCECDLFINNKHIDTLTLYNNNNKSMMNKKYKKGNKFIVSWYEDSLDCGMDTIIKIKGNIMKDYKLLSDPRNLTGKSGLI